MTDHDRPTHSAYLKRVNGQPLPQWQEELNATHRRIRARVEHALAGMKTSKSPVATAAPPTH